MVRVVKKKVTHKGVTTSHEDKGGVPVLVRILRSLPVTSLLAVCAGLALWAAFPDISAWYLSFPAVACVLALSDSFRARRATWHVILFSYTFWLPHIQWATLATGGTLPPWLALSTIQVFAWLLWLFIFRASLHLPLSRHPAVYAIYAGVSWVGVEQLRSMTPWSGFPWGNLAYPQVDSPLASFAPWGGEVLVSFLVVVIAALLRRGLSPADWRGRAKVHQPLLACVAAVVVFGSGFAIPAPVHPDGPTVTVGIVQGNVELPGAQTFAVEGKVAGNHAKVHRSFLDSPQRPDIIFWGENSLDRNPAKSPLVASIVDSAVREVGVPTMVGYTEFIDDYRYNWVSMWTPDSGLVEETKYGKQIPVPFGEYIPLRDLVSRFAIEAAQVSVDLVPVENSAHVTVPTASGSALALSVGICFEVGYEALLAEGVRSGGEMLVIPTNNYHFGTSPQSSQQGQMLRFRSISFVRSGVQASTTGHSYVTTPKGAVIAESDAMVPAAVTAQVSLSSGLTPLAVWAQWWHFGAMTGAGAIVIFRFWHLLCQKLG